MGGAFEGFPVVITRNAIERLLTFLGRVRKAACCVVLCYFLCWDYSCSYRRNPFVTSLGVGCFIL